MKSQPIPPESPSAPAVSEHEQRLDDAIAHYLEAVHAGQTPDRVDLLARHPDLADDLRSFFADEDRLKGLAGSLFVREPHGGHDSSHGGSRAHASGIRDQGRRRFRRVRVDRRNRRRRDGGRFQGPAQEPGRIVALKTIRPAAFRPGTDAIQRFRIEAEAVAGSTTRILCRSTRWASMAAFPISASS